MLFQKKYFLSLVLILSFSNFLFSFQNFDFFGLKLDISYNTLKQDIQNSSTWRIDDTSYLSLLSDQNQTTMLIYPLTQPYVKKVIIDFYNDKAYQINIQFNGKYYDFYSIYTTLNSKYGKPVKYTSKFSFWQDGNTFALLEKSGNLKIYHPDIVNKLIENTKETPTHYLNNAIYYEQRQSILNEL